MNIPYIIIMAVCLVLSAFFSATEEAFAAVNRAKLKSLSDKGNKRATRTLYISEHRENRLKSTILVGDTLADMVFAVLATLTLLELIQLGEVYRTLIAVVATTVAILLVGEITPKCISEHHPERVAMFLTPFIRFFMIILFPLSGLFSLWRLLLSKIVHRELEVVNSQEELLAIVEEVEEDGTIDEEEGDLLRNAITFTEQKAEDILTHRVDLEAFDRETPMEEIAQMFIDSGYSRLLVYEESIDHIIGVVHQKDLFTVHGITDKPLDDLITLPIFVHKTERIDALLRELQTSKSHMAVVLDEYGGTLGIVTMEDILEELVGDIWDEHDEVVEDYREVTANTFRVDCGESLEEFADFFDLVIDSDSITVNGWIMEELDRIPTCGEKFSYANLDITVMETELHRVATIEVVRHEVADDDKEKDKDKKDKEKEKEKKDKDKEKVKSAT